VRTMVLAIRLRASRTSANSIERIASSVVGTVSFFLRRKRIRVDYIADQKKETYSRAGPIDALRVQAKRTILLKWTPNGPNLSAFLV
jgi:hypothetical protein